MKNFNIFSKKVLTQTFFSVKIGCVVKANNFTRMDGDVHLSKDLSINLLMDFYAELLTDKQREALELYYNDDFSLAEIAQHMDISRQGVRDFIKRGEKQLFDFESCLGLVGRFDNISKEVAKMEALISNLQKPEHDALSLQLNKIKEYL